MRWPAEWEPHEAVWIGFPGDPLQWPVGLDETRKEVAAFADAVSDGGAGEQVVLVCRTQADAIAARKLVDSKVDVIDEPFGDIWFRDTGSIITEKPNQNIAHDFGFNGWGNKFEMAGDQDIGLRLALARNLPVVEHEWVLEGGAIDGDGAGSLITTEQCTLNSNRNPGLAKDDAEQRLKRALGIGRICWLGQGLINDHTDGHIDNVARFVAEGITTVPKADDENDPNAVIFEDAAERLQHEGFVVVRISSVGKYEIDGQIAPASYMNFYIGNRVVVVPQYQSSNDSKVLEEIGSLFPTRKVIGLPSAALLRGGGSFHCISQQIPATGNRT